MPEIEGKRGGGSFFDCEKGGSHRFGKGVFFPKNPDLFIQACRRCGRKKITTFVISDGKIIPTVQEID